jgi:sporulation protein YlmC with PRC-barrel domain
VSVLKVANLNGKKVITSEAQVLGEVGGAEIEIIEWKVTHLYISLTKEVTEKFNFKKPLLGSVTVCLPVTAIKAVGDVITLDQTMKNLKFMPEFKVQK